MLPCLCLRKAVFAGLLLTIPQTTTITRSSHFTHSRRIPQTPRTPVWRPPLSSSRQADTVLGQPELQRVAAFIVPAAATVLLYDEKEEQELFVVLQGETQINWRLNGEV